MKRKREFFPSTHVEVTRRQGIIRDIFGMGNFYEPHDFYNPLNVRGPEFRRKIVERAKRVMAKAPERQRLAATRKVLAEKLVTRKGPAVGKAIAARRLEIEARKKGLKPISPRTKALAKMIPPKLYRSLRSGPKDDVMRLPATRQTYLVTAPQPVLRDEYQLPTPRHAYNRVGKLVAPGSEQPYVDPASINVQTDAYQRTANQVIQVSQEPHPTFYDEEVPSTWFNPMESMTKRGDQPFVPKDRGIGEPEKTAVIHEKDYGLFQHIDKQLRPPMLISKEEMGFPYMRGEAQRYAGMTSGAAAVTPVDPSVIKGQPWQSPAFAHHNLPEGTIQNDPDPEAGMGAWPSGLGIDSREMAHKLYDRISFLEQEIEGLNPAAMADVASDFAVQRATIQSLFEDIERTPTAGVVEIAKSATFMATGKYYLEKLEKEYEKVSREAPRPVPVVHAEPVVSEPVKKAALGVGAVAALAALGVGGYLLYKAS